MERSGHIPVLLDQVVALAFPEGGQTFADVTFGLGGHTNAVLARYPSIRRVVAIDRDMDILRRSERTAPDARITRVHGRSTELCDVLAQLGIGSVDGILADLGVSSPQLDESDRGFSFTRDGPLDMRMDRSSGGATAADLVNTVPERELSRIFHEYGEERHSRRIASAIVKRRDASPFATTAELAKFIEGVAPARGFGAIHPATRVFQALRIAVNDELSELERFLPMALSVLAPGGRLAVISFHSLEDRIVKSFFAAEQKGCTCPPKFPVCVCGNRPTIEILTRKPVTADDAETTANPRARSAKLRVARKLPAEGRGA
ncbi:MAG TPA: 16S rRNA (cytosine(1402)-N(4))-methyltransferase RsmH [Candidatus Ozemobacteraceae bacterium]|nr:16S rRNA (cytosine(1402)-N(4))-methyltransferase RsmH [Candidatus Ozemobacteraceae bacterium]